MRAVALLAIGVLALAAAACGGDSAGEPTVVPSTPTAAATAQPPSPTPTEPPPATATTSPQSYSQRHARAYRPELRGND